MNEYQIPDIKISSSLTIKQRMRICCDMAFDELKCDELHCKECLFSQCDITPEQEEQFLKWEETIKEEK